MRELTPRRQDGDGLLDVVLNGGDGFIYMLDHTGAQTALLPPLRSEASAGKLMLPASTMDIRLNSTLSYVMDPVVCNSPDLALQPDLSLALQIADVTGDGFPDIIVGASLRPDSTQSTFVRVYNNVGHLAAQISAHVCTHR